MGLRPSTSGCPLPAFLSCPLFSECLPLGVGFANCKDGRFTWPMFPAVPKVRTWSTVSRGHLLFFSAFENLPSWEGSLPARKDVEGGFLQVQSLRLWLTWRVHNFPGSGPGSTRLTLRGLGAMHV